MMQKPTIKLSQELKDQLDKLVINKKEQGGKEWHLRITQLT